MSEIYIIRLTSGEEIIGYVKEDNEQHVLVEHPTIIMHGANPKTGQLDINMAPLLPLAVEKELPLKQIHVVFKYKPVEQIELKYSSIFSKIIQPEKSLIIP